MPLIAYAAIAVGLIPCVALSIYGGSRRDWLLGAAFAVSFLADVGALEGDPKLMGAVYPLAQAGLVGVALLDWKQAGQLATVLLVVALVSLHLGGAETNEVLLNTVAGLFIAGLPWYVQGPVLPDSLSWSLLLTFGLGTVLWWWLAVDPGWPSWGAYQGCRLLGAGAFCWAVSRPETA